MPRVWITVSAYWNFGRNDMAETVTLRSPDGEVREVEATVDSLSPLMARGWVQVKDGGEDAGEYS